MIVAEIGAILPNLSMCGKFGPVSARSARIRLTSARLGQSCPDFGQLRPIVARIWSRAALRRFGTNLAEMLPTFGSNAMLNREPLNLVQSHMSAQPDYAGIGPNSVDPTPRIGRCRPKFGRRRSDCGPNMVERNLGSKPSRPTQSASEVSAPSLR